MRPFFPSLHLATVPAWDTSRTGTRKQRGLPITPRVPARTLAIPLRMTHPNGQPLYKRMELYEYVPGTEKVRAVQTGAIVSLRREARRAKARAAR